MKNDEALTPSLEDYLEAIYQLEQKYRVARVKDIAELLNVQMPSVTGAVKNLGAKNLVNYEKNSFISLTEKGLAIAKSVQRRHSVLQSFLEEVLLLSPEEARDQACKMEHSINPETAQRFLNCLQFVRDELFEKKVIDTKSWAKIIQAP